MSSTQFKLTRNSHTRRLTLADQPNWLALATRIESYFDIPVDKVAVAYTDNDGDEVTLSSQEELVDFFASFHKSGESVRFNVVDLRQLRSVGSGPSVHSDRNHISPGGMGAMGPTMFFDVDDRPEWPPLPRFFSAGGVAVDDIMDDEDANRSSVGHAYVETVHSEDTAPQVQADARTPSRLSTASANTLKGKEKAESVAAASTVSLIDEDVPDKPTPHVKAVPLTAGISALRNSVLDDGKDSPSVHSSRFAAGGARLSTFGIDSVGDSYFAEKLSPSGSQAGGLRPRTPSTGPSSFFNVPPSQDFGSSILREVLGQVPAKPASTQSAADARANHTESTSPATKPRTAEETSHPEVQAQTSEPTVNTEPPVQRSFITDVANLLDSLTAAFTAHPELSEGLQNIVRGATNGAYWSTERERAAHAAESVRRAAEETSQRINQVADEARYNAEQRIAQSLGGVFRVIGELSGGLTGLSPENSATTAQKNSNNRNFAAPPYPPPPPGPGHPRWGHVFPPPPPPPFGHPAPPPFGPTPPHPHPPPPIFYPPVGFGAFHQPPTGGQTTGAPQKTSDLDLHAPPHMRTRPWSVRLASPRVAPQRNNSWSVGPALGDNVTSNDVYPYAAPETPDEERMSAFERKARLEAAKQYYRQQKEEFVKEKERRRQQRRELAGRRAEDNVITSEASETIVTRIPLGANGEIPPTLGTAKQKEIPFAGIFDVPSPTRDQPFAGPSHSQGNKAQRRAKTKARPTPSFEQKDRVIAGLMEMGITKSHYPNLDALLDVHMKTGDSTADVVTKMIDELALGRSPSPLP